MLEYANTPVSIFIVLFDMCFYFEILQACIFYIFHPAAFHFNVRHFSNKVATAYENCLEPLQNPPLYPPLLPPCGCSTGLLQKVSARKRRVGPFFAE